MKKVLPLVLLFAVLIYILPLAALFFPSGKNEESGSGTAPAPSASAPPVTDGTQAPSAPQPGTSAADDAEPPLLILDEIGRGTSTFDGMSIARAVLEFCADPKKLGAKTLFATHYHELTELEGILPGVKNYSISIKKRGDELIFLRKIVPGGADRSYGIEVAKLAGLPNEVVKRANVILKELEQGGAYQAKPREETEQVSLDAIGEAEVLAAIRRAQPDTMSPIEAMQLLYELKQKLS